MAKLGRFDNVLSDAGVPIVATVTVYDAGTSDLADLWTDAGGTIVKDNPFQTDALGRFQFFATSGKYDIEVLGTGITTYKIESVNLSDVTQSTELSDMPPTLGVPNAGKVPVVAGDGLAYALGNPVPASHALIGSTSHGDTVGGTTNVLGDTIFANASLVWQRLAGQITTTRKFLRQVGTGSASAPPAWDTIAEADLPAHNVLSAAHGDALAAAAVLGDILHGNATPKWARLAGQITTTKKFLTQTGSGSVSAVPAWGTIAAGDIPAHASSHVPTGSDPLSLQGSATWDPASIANNTGLSTTVTVTGAVLGDFALASFSLDLQGMSISACVSSANTVTVTLINVTGGAINLGSGTLRARVWHY